MSRGRGRPPYPDVLTPSEWAVVHLLQHGLSNRRIAELRGTSLDATKQHVATAIAKLGLADRSELRQWTAIPAGSPRRRSKLEGGVMSATSETVHLGPLGQVSLPVTDIERAVAFYRDTLGLPHLYTYGPLAFLDCDGTRLYLAQGGEGGGPLPPSTSILYFQVSDIEAAYDALRERGITFDGAPHRIHTHPDGTEEWMAFFHDPDQNTLGLISQVRPER
ncbi:MAG: VOC family protein [Candidatus Dormibacteraeota bacterium]|nr:VOC family protein [Candidatus Dormibacteraeota bacterium]